MQTVTLVCNSCETINHCLVTMIGKILCKVCSTGKKNTCCNYFHQNLLKLET